MPTVNWWVVLDSSTNNYSVVSGVTVPTGSHTLFPYPTQAAAQAQANLLNKSTKQGVVKTVAQGLDPLNWFHGLNLGAWLLRIGEIILGVVLVGVGVAKLTGADNYISKAATMAGKVAVL
jgi:hypothetical protein